MSPYRHILTVSAPQTFLWTLIGFILTVFGTFVQAYTTNFPWLWVERGVDVQPLGIAWQVGAVLLAGCLGGRTAGLLSQLAYVSLGLALVPIFGQGGGWGYWQEPSFGYILGFVPGAWVCGWLALRSRPAKLESLAASAAAGLLAIHGVGLTYLLMYSLLGTRLGLESIAFEPAAAAYSVAPIPAQAVALCGAATIAFGLRRLLFY